jgi:hypothetical protein
MDDKNQKYNYVTTFHVPKNDVKISQARESDLSVCVCVL